jgi:sigma-B regulation protein RsbU (phosphoserine phosphatase)
MHGIFLPASQTGGDTYDFKLTPHGLLLVLADAAGHGLAPALSVTQMHAMLRMAVRLGADLETAFRHVNDQLAETLQDGRFVNAFIGLLDPSTHRLRFLSGGQGPILHFRAASGDWAQFRATSFPMGAMPMGHLKPPVDLDLAPGDLLALITDGVFEYEDVQGQPFGVPTALSYLAAHAREPARCLAEGLLAELRRFGGVAPQEDDITMVIVKRLPAS